MESKKVIEREKNAYNTNNVVVVLPTYNEAENIENMILMIEGLNVNSEIGILVVDDSSPDGTREIVRKLQRKYGNITLIVRPRKMGLGTALKDTFSFLASLPNRPRYVITMDADFSHNPRDIPRLLELAEKGYDVVIGSRYVKGGKTKGWPPMRVIISRMANKIARILIKIPIKDFTSGFRCYSMEYILNVLPSLHSQTYEIQIETLKQAQLLNAKVAEVPIVFENRKKGKSKLSANEIRSFLRYMIKLLVKKVV